jgi:RNA polymerase sigma-70 factor (ECF subfamily)
MMSGRAEEPPDPDLVDRIRRGDESALELLYARYGGLVYTLALRIVGDRELAREVLQDAFVRAWTGGETYDPARGRVPAWLMGIARNRAIDLLRSRPHQARMRERDPLASGLTTGEDTADAIALRQAVQGALHGLSSAQRQTIELAYYAGLTQTEIAQELGDPLGTVKRRTREGMDRLRHALAPILGLAGKQERRD